jgi:hypothetical protein
MGPGKVIFSWTPAIVTWPGKRSREDRATGWSNAGHPAAARRTTSRCMTRRLPAYFVIRRRGGRT